MVKKWLYCFILCVCVCSVTKSCLTLCDPMDHGTPGLLVPHHLLEFAQVYVHWISNAIKHLILCLPSSPSAFNLSQHQGLFQWVSSSNQVAKVLELQLQLPALPINIQANKYSGLISLWIDWFDLLAVQGTLKSIREHYSLKASILLHSAFFMVQLLH